MTFTTETRFIYDPFKSKMARQTMVFRNKDVFDALIAQGLCPICKKPKSEFRRKNATCCCPECTKSYWSNCMPWNHFRRKIFGERGRICASCGKKIKYSEKWTLDHIHPLALGGEMWEESNLQILCGNSGIGCCKIKDAADAKLIAEARRNPGKPLPKVETLDTFIPSSIPPLSVPKNMRLT